MAKLYHLNCPNCGGLIASKGERVIECKYCHSRSLVLIPDWTPRYYIKPELDFAKARREMVSLFKREDVESGLLQNARFESADLFFVPFYLFRGRRIGVFTSFGKPYTTTGMILEGYRNSELTYRQLVDKQRSQEQSKTDSRVIFSDIERSFPAVKLEDWGLEEFEPDKVIVAEGLELNQYRKEELDRLGVVLEPRINATEWVSQIFKTPELAYAQDQTQIVEQRTALVYYPVWRIRWRYQGRAYQTTLEAVRGKILFTRAPAKERARVAWLLAVSGAVGLSLGKLLKIPMLILAMGFLSIWLILLFSVVLLFFVAFGWNMFRYSSEIVISGEHTDMEFIGRPPETVFDKMAMKLSGVLEQAMREARRRQEEWR